MREVVEYARQRHIRVVPEIELPGHAQAALAAYPEYACTDGPFEVVTEWGVFDEVFCAGNDATFRFLEDVFEEVLALFPDDYVHIGGDECPKTRWKACPRCQQRMRDEGLESEEELQSYFVRHFAAWLRGPRQKAHWLGRNLGGRSGQRGGRYVVARRAGRLRGCIGRSRCSNGAGDARLL